MEKLLQKKKPISPVPSMILYGMGKLSYVFISLHLKLLYVCASSFNTKRYKHTFLQSIYIQGPTEQRVIMFTLLCVVVVALG